MAARSSSAESSRARITSACVHEDHAGLGEPHAAREPLDELRARLALERSDVLAHGRLREVQRLGGGRERAAGSHLAQHLHPADIEHQHSLSQCQAGFIGTNGSHLLSWERMSRRSTRPPAPAQRVLGRVVPVHQGRTRRRRGARGRSSRSGPRSRPWCSCRSRRGLAVLGSLRGRLGPVFVLALVQVAAPAHPDRARRGAHLLLAHRDPRGERADLHVPARVRSHAASSARPTSLAGRGHRHRRRGDAARGGRRRRGARRSSAACS